MKQTIEIEVPEGKKAVWKDGKVVFRDGYNWEEITTCDQVCDIMRELWAKGKDKDACALYCEYIDGKAGSYSRAITLYRMLVYLLTDNEERFFTEGETWLPVTYYTDSNFKPDDRFYRVGTIMYNKKEYNVLSSVIPPGNGAGIGSYNGYRSIAFVSAVRGVSNKKVAEHIAKYFGQLLFKIQYGGTNCYWKWIEKPDNDGKASNN